MDVDYLREALRQDAKLAGVPEPNLYEQVRARRQKSDRRRLSAVAAGLAALLVGIGVPISLNELYRSSESGQGRQFQFYRRTSWATDPRESGQ